MKFGKTILTYESNGKNYNLEFDLLDGASDQSVKINASLTAEGRGNRLKVTAKSTAEIKLIKLVVMINKQFLTEDKLFLNGYQSWTASREFRIDERQPPLSRLLKPLYKKYNLKGYGDYSFNTYSGKKGVLHSYTYTYIRQNDDIEFAGSLSEGNGFTLFRYDIQNANMKIEKDCEGLLIQDEKVILDIWTATGSEDNLFDDYFKLQVLGDVKSSLCSGWTSWYNYYTNITEEIISENIDAFRQRNVEIDVFQIDDGFQRAVGDWLETNDKFTHGMKSLSDKAHAANYRAGLWLAPFVCEQKSDIMTKHPDWLLRTADGKPVKAGRNDNWSGHFYALDFYNDEFRNYLTQVFHKVLDEWNFDLVKLDFLYAVCLLPRKGKPRGMIMEEAMAFLRKLTGSKWILGCGVPLASAWGKADYCRIGCDVGLGWDDHAPAIIHVQERVSTVNAISDAIGRYHQDARGFRNDPDVFLLRSNNISLSTDQKLTLLLVNSIFGSLLFTSDNLAEYTTDEYERYLSHLPLVEKKINFVRTLEGFYYYEHLSSIAQLITGLNPYETVYKIEFKAANHTYTAIINLGSKSIDVSLERGLYYDSISRNFYADSLIKLAPYTSACLLHSEVKSLGFAGSEGHLFAGCEIAAMSNDGAAFNLSVHGPEGRRKGVYITASPKADENVTVNGNPASLVGPFAGYRFWKLVV
jgi:alpha-galactosidase